MTLRGAAWGCLLSGVGLAALGWFGWSRAYLFELLVPALVAVIAGSHLLTAANQMPPVPADRERGAP